MVPLANHWSPFSWESVFLVPSDEFNRLVLSIALASTLIDDKTLSEVGRVYRFTGLDMSEILSF